MKNRIIILVLLCAAAVASSIYALEAARSWDRISQDRTSVYLDIAQTQTNIGLASSGELIHEYSMVIPFGGVIHNEIRWSKEDISRAENHVRGLERILSKLNEEKFKARKSGIRKGILAALLCLSAIGYGVLVLIRWANNPDAPRDKVDSFGAENIETSVIVCKYCRQELPDKKS